MNSVPCPVCGNPARFVGCFDAHVATWNCDQPRSTCKMGGFSEYVWPTMARVCGFRRLPEMTTTMLQTYLEAARTADYPELVAAIERELEGRVGR